MIDLIYLSKNKLQELKLIRLCTFNKHKDGE